MISIIFIIFVVEGIKIKVRHQLSLHVVHGFIQRLDELVEVFFVQEDLVSVVTLICETFPAFGDGEVIIITSCGPYIKEIGSSLTCA